MNVFRLILNVNDGTLNINVQVITCRIKKQIKQALDDIITMLLLESSTSKGNSREESAITESELHKGTHPLTFVGSHKDRKSTRLNSSHL